MLVCSFCSSGRAAGQAIYSLGHVMRNPEGVSYYTKGGQ